jgi:hypothetical protein
VGNNLDTTVDIPILVNLWHQYQYQGKRRKLTSSRKFLNFFAVTVGALWIQAL